MRKMYILTVFIFIVLIPILMCIPKEKDEEYKVIISSIEEYDSVENILIKEGWELEDIYETDDNVECTFVRTSNKS